MRPPGSRFNDNTKMPPFEPPVTMRDYEDMLYNHKWTFLTDNYRDFIASKREEDRLYEISKRGGFPYLSAYTASMRRALSNNLDDACHKLRLELLERHEKDLLTGDEEFDTFRRRVKNFDFFYSYSDDGNVWRNGEKNYQELTKIAKEKGGLFETYWAYMREKMYKK